MRARNPEWPECTRPHSRERFRIRDFRAPRRTRLSLMALSWSPRPPAISGRTPCTSTGCGRTCPTRTPPKPRPRSALQSRRPLVVRRKETASGAPCPSSDRSGVRILRSDDRPEIARQATSHYNIGRACLAAGAKVVCGNPFDQTAIRNHEYHIRIGSQFGSGNQFALVGRATGSRPCAHLVPRRGVPSLCTDIVGAARELGPLPDR